jgi:16S rRNA (cytosine1402-N4)-methyltransferase
VASGPEIENWPRTTGHGPLATAKLKPRVPDLTALRLFLLTRIPPDHAVQGKMLEELPRKAVRHIPVLADAVLELLEPEPGQVVVDATTGVGGHARLLAERIGSTGRLICLDRDPEMLALAQRELTELSQITFLQGNFEDLPEILQKLHIGPVDAVLADLGFCTDQQADPQRGLSFQQDGPLDMRLDRTRGEPASALVQRLRENELADIFWQYGEERYSRRVARKIVEFRKIAPLTTTGQLADLVRQCVPRVRRASGVPLTRPPIDPATRVFQALRIAVNDELGALERLLKVLPDCVKPGGRVAIISFHSLEDRLVKRAFRQRENFVDLTKKPRIASQIEICHNPRARSAKLRAARIRP